MIAQTTTSPAEVFASEVFIIGQPKARDAGWYAAMTAEPPFCLPAGFGATDVLEFSPQYLPELPELRFVGHRLTERTPGVTFKSDSLPEVEVLKRQLVHFILEGDAQLIWGHDEAVVFPAAGLTGFCFVDMTIADGLITVIEDNLDGHVERGTIVYLPM